MRFGRLYEGVVVEVEEPPPGCTIEDCVGEQQASEYISLPDGVDVGHSQDIDGNWMAPLQSKKEGVEV